MLELTAGLFAKCTAFGNAIFYSTRDNNVSELKGLLSKLNENPNKYNSAKRTALNISLISGSKEATVILLEYGADPNLIVRRTGETFEKTPQYCIDAKDYSTIKLLAMYGATTEGLSFPPGFEDIKQVFEQAINKKLALNTKLYQLAIEQAKSNADIKQLIAYCQNAADIWHNLATEETEPVYRKHYYEKAFKLYQQAESYFQKLPKANICTADVEYYAKLFERLADISSKLHLSSETAIYSKLTAELIAQADKRSAHLRETLFYPSRPLDEQSNGTSLAKNTYRQSDMDTSSSSASLLRHIKND